MDGAAADGRGADDDGGRRGGDGREQTSETEAPTTQVGVRERTRLKSIQNKPIGGKHGPNTNKDGTEAQEAATSNANEEEERENMEVDTAEHGENQTTRKRRNNQQRRTPPQRSRTEHTLREHAELATRIAEDAPNDPLIRHLEKVPLQNRLEYLEILNEKKPKTLYRTLAELPEITSIMTCTQCNSKGVFYINGSHGPTLTEGKRRKLTCRKATDRRTHSNGCGRTAGEIEWANLFASEKEHINSVIMKTHVLQRQPKRYQRNQNKNPTPTRNSSKKKIELADVESESHSSGDENAGIARPPYPWYSPRHQGENEQDATPTNQILSMMRTQIDKLNEMQKTQERNTRKMDKLNEMQEMQERNIRIINHLIEKDNEKTAAMEKMQEQLNAITERIECNTQPATPIESAAVRRQPVARNNPIAQARPQQEDNTDNEHDAIIRPVQTGEEPNWAEIVRRNKRRNDFHLGPQYAEKLRTGRAYIAALKRKANRRKPNPNRELEVMYFSNAGDLPPWQLKNALFKAIYDERSGEPAPIIFISKIGRSVREVITDKRIANKAAAFLIQWSHKKLKDIDPLGSMVKKQSTRAGHNEAKINAEKCKHRAKECITKFAGPEIIAYFEKLIKKANEVINMPTTRETEAQTETTNGNNNDNGTETTNRDEARSTEQNATEREGGKKLSILGNEYDSAQLDRAETDNDADMEDTNEGADKSGAPKDQGMDDETESDAERGTTHKYPSPPARPQREENNAQEQADK